ncbi:MAG: hypothetical protein LQ343_001280 [Gyalolechia ehrenbergii]|nr:MAG: hypothetical protein LQ343_001280 [Gyalolechia ehrenbergii]
MTSLSSQEIRVLEQARQRLYQLTDSLNSLNRDVYNGQPLPSWSSLASRFSILAQNLSSLSTHLSTHSSLFSALAVFPLPEFPREQENLLGQMLRKKLEPGVEEWVGQGLEMGRREGCGRDLREGGDSRGDRGMGEGGGGGRGEGMDEDAWKGLWEWVMVRANEEAREYEWGVGGEDEEEGEEEEEGEDGMDVEEEEGGEGFGGGGGERGDKGEKVEEAGRALRMEEVLRFMNTGMEPRR